MLNLGGVKVDKLNAFGIWWQWRVLDANLGCSKWFSIRHTESRGYRQISCIFSSIVHSIEKSFQNSRCAHSREDQPEFVHSQKAVEFSSLPTTHCILSNAKSTTSKKITFHLISTSSFLARALTKCSFSQSRPKLLAKHREIGKWIHYPIMLRLIWTRFPWNGSKAMHKYDAS